MPIGAGLPVWVLADDRAGNVGQCLGVAEALRLSFEVKTIRYTRLAALPNLMKGAGPIGLTRDSRAGLASGPGPGLVIAAGRRTASAARWIKRRSGAFLVQIMDPGPGGRDEFDLIAVPGHDGRRINGPNVMPIVGAPHRVTPERLADEAAAWAPRFAHLPRPWVGLVVGGATRRRPFTAGMARELALAAARLAGGGALLVTTSRRTGVEAERALFADLPGPLYAHRWDAGGDNPYFGILGAADAVVVTGDSVSMCCEACAAPAPVYVWAPEGWVTAKHGRLHADLFRLGYARPLVPDARLEHWSHPPLNAARAIADEIRRRLG